MDNIMSILVTSAHTKGRGCGRVIPLRAVGTLLSTMGKESHADLRREAMQAECDDAIAMCEAEFWDDELNRTEFLAL